MKTASYLIFLLVFLISSLVRGPKITLNVFSYLLYLRFNQLYPHKRALEALSQRPINPIFATKIMPKQSYLAYLH